MLYSYESRQCTVPKMTPSIMLFVNVGSKKFRKLAKLVKALTLSSCPNWSAFCCQLLHFKCSSATFLRMFFTFYSEVKVFKFGCGWNCYPGIWQSLLLHFPHLSFILLYFFIYFFVGDIQVDNNDSLGCAQLIPSGRGKKKHRWALGIFCLKMVICWLEQLLREHKRWEVDRFDLLYLLNFITGTGL